MLSSALCLSALLVVNVVLSQAAVLSTCPSTDDPKVQKKIIEITNNYRRNVQPTARNMLEVSWSKEAAKNAAAWAKTCQFDHSKPEQRKIKNYTCGENLYMASPVGSWEEAFKMFDDEKKVFVYGEEPKEGEMVGHHTQQVWYKSRLMGCACAHCPGKKFEFFYVCQYCPPGNVNSVSKPYEKGPTCADCPKHCNNGLCTNPCTENDTFINCKQLAEKHCGVPYIKKECAGSCTCKDKII